MESKAAENLQQSAVAEAGLHDLALPETHPKLELVRMVQRLLAENPEKFAVSVSNGQLVADTLLNGKEGGLCGMQLRIAMQETEGAPGKLLEINLFTSIREPNYIDPWHSFYRLDVIGGAEVREELHRMIELARTVPQFAAAAKELGYVHLGADETLRFTSQWAETTIPDAKALEGLKEVSELTFPPRLAGFKSFADLLREAADRGESEVLPAGAMVALRLR